MALLDILPFDFLICGTLFLILEWMTPYVLGFSTVGHSPGHRLSNETQWEILINALLFVKVQLV